MKDMITCNFCKESFRPAYGNQVSFIYCGALLDLASDGSKLTVRFREEPAEQKDVKESPEEIKEKINFLVKRKIFLETLNYTQIYFKPVALLGGTVFLLFILLILIFSKGLNDIIDFFLFISLVSMLCVSFFARLILDGKLKIEFPLLDRTFNTSEDRNNLHREIKEIEKQILDLKNKYSLFF